MPIIDARLPTTHEAIRELGSHEDAAALKALAEVAAVHDQFLRRTALEVIGRHPQGRELCAIILGAFADPSEYVVRTACTSSSAQLNDALSDEQVPLGLIDTDGCVSYKIQ